MKGSVRATNDQGVFILQHMSSSLALTSSLQWSLVLRENKQDMQQIRVMNVGPESCNVHRLDSIEGLPGKA
jgi:hypothetical protein